MPHQEHLPQAGREFAHRSRLPGTAPWLAALSLAAALLLLLCLWPAAEASAQNAPGWPQFQIDAVRATGWHDTAPPADGWTPVKLPDVWDERWPRYDGVVWYRLRWHQPAALPEAGLLLRYLNMSGEVRLNDTVISRDQSLVTPLTRAWNTPRYWLLAAPLLRPGADNELLVRVSGLAPYQAGLGPVELGPADDVQTAYNRERILRRDLQVLGLAVSAAVSAFFAALWLLRRRETAYGWFALMSVVWLLFGYNQIATSPWPFHDNHAWQAMNTSLLLAFGLTFVVFTLRFCNRRMPRTELGILGVVIVGCFDLWLAGPEHLMLHRALWTVLGGTMTVVVGCVASVQAWRSRERTLVSLVPFMMMTAAAGIHDMLVFTQVLASNIYYTVMSSYALLLGMALIQAARFVSSLRRIEHFNTELIEEVNAAKAELAATLAQRHALELAHARIGERVNLVSDLHDGLGGMLVGSIATLERAPQNLSAPQLLSMLKSLRDDLRLIIDANGSDDGAHALGDLLAPLRHRLTQLLDANGIDCRWKVSGIETLELPPSQNLDLLRLLQEGLTNVLKHSGAQRVDVSVAATDGDLRVEIRDDGRGFVVDAPARRNGAGLRSMQARARRLGGELRLHSQPGRTELALRMPLSVPAALPA